MLELFGEEMVPPSLTAWVRLPVKPRQAFWNLPFLDQLMGNDSRLGLLVCINCSYDSSSFVQKHETRSGKRNKFGGQRFRTS